MNELDSSYFDYLSSVKRKADYTQFDTLIILNKYLAQQLKPYHSLKTVRSPEICMRFFSTVGIRGAISKQFANDICKNKKVYESCSLAEWAVKLLETLHAYERITLLRDGKILWLIKNLCYNIGIGFCEIKFALNKKQTHRTTTKTGLVNKVVVTFLIKENMKTLLYFSLFFILTESWKCMDNGNCNCSSHKNSGIIECTSIPLSLEGKPRFVKILNIDFEEPVTCDKDLIEKLNFVGARKIRLVSSLWRSVEKMCRTLEIMQK